MRAVLAEAYDLSPTEAAAILDVHPDTLKRWVKAGKVAAIKTPTGWYRFRRSDLEAALTVLPVTDGAATSAK